MPQNLNCATISSQKQFDAFERPRPSQNAYKPSLDCPVLRIPLPKPHVLLQGNWTPRANGSIAGPPIPLDLAPTRYGPATTGFRMIPGDLTMPGPPAFSPTKDQVIERKTRTRWPTDEPFRSLGGQLPTLGPSAIERDLDYLAASAKTPDQYGPKQPADRK